MINVKLLCVGKLKEKFYADACAEYAKRLGRYCRLDITELPESRLPQAPTPGEIAAALEKEGEAIRTRIPPGSIVVALCVEGEAYSSEQLAQALTRWAQAGSKGLVLVIGGSYGLHPSGKKLARLRLSMSPMTFPHHLARVMALEQLYRAFKIQEGSSYHK